VTAGLLLGRTPKGRLSRYEKALTDRPWHQVRDGVEVKLLSQEGEVYVLAQSRDRIHKERSMRRRQLKRLWKRLQELRGMPLSRDQLLLKLGAAQQQSPSAWRLVHLQVRKGNEPGSSPYAKTGCARFAAGRGVILLRTNLVGRDPAQMWEFYTQLVQVEEAFKTLKGT